MTQRILEQREASAIHGISVQHVHYHYEPGHHVLQDVSIDIRPGSTAIIGQNGAGKTTLMKLLNGLLKPTQGEIHIGDWNTKDFDVSQIAKRVGLVFQNPDDQIFKTKVIDEVMFGPLNVGMSFDVAKRSALEALAEVGLEHVADENPYDLSYAERKRVCVASILAMNTDVVILDEPTISQDALDIERMGALIQQLCNRGKTVIAIVHDMEFAADYFNRVVVMAEGRILADGSAKSVFYTFDTLEAAHVEAPEVIRLASGVGLQAQCLSVSEFAHQYRAQNG